MNRALRPFAVASALLLAFAALAACTGNGTRFSGGSDHSGHSGRAHH